MNCAFIHAILVIKLEICNFESTRPNQWPCREYW